jgi:hypothetical protein
MFTFLYAECEPAIRLVRVYPPVFCKHRSSFNPTNKNIMELGLEIQTIPPRLPLRIRHTFMRAYFLTMIDTTISQNIELSSWTTLYTSLTSTPHRTYHISIMKSVQLMILRTIIVIHCENQLKKKKYSLQAKRRLLERQTGWHNHHHSSWKTDRVAQLSPLFVKELSRNFIVITL